MLAGKQFPIGTLKLHLMYIMSGEIESYPPSHLPVFKHQMLSP